MSENENSGLNEVKDTTTSYSPIPFEEPIILVDDEPEEIPQVEEPVVSETTSVGKEDIVSERIQQNVTLDAEVVYEADWNDKEEVVNFPSASDKVSAGAIELAPNVNLTDSAESRKWASVLASGMQTSSFDEVYLSTLNDKEASFRQGLKHNGAFLAGAFPKFKSLDNESVKGERGILRFMSYFGMGGIFQAPLWHSGIWVTFKSPTEGELLELQRQLISDKIEFGRTSYGLAFSNSSSYIADRLVSFAFDHIYSTSLKTEDASKVDLKTLISSHDIPTVVWGLLCSIYPRGFQYRRACVTDPEKCNHVVEERLALSKIQFPNELSLTPAQVTHMSSRRDNSKDIESIKRYKEELLKCQNRVIVLGKGSTKETKITLKIPTIAEYVDSGHRWIGEIVAMVNRALGMEADEEDRNSYISKHGKATSMRQYLHWVESIDFGNTRIEDISTLEGLFDVLSSDDIIRDEFSAEVAKYINETAIAVIAIPEYDCPKCGSTQKSSIVLPRHANLIPIDIFQTFFSLLGQKLERVNRR